MKNRVSGLLMETGVSYNKLRLHRMGYFAELMSNNEEVSESIRPLLSLCREHIDRSIRLAISYCGLCSAEKSSADKVMRTPISKQRNKHIQQVLVEAARLAPRYSHELALIHEKEKQRGDRNRATLAVARKMVASMVAVERRKQDFVPAEERGGTVAA